MADSVFSRSWWQRWGGWLILVAGLLAYQTSLRAGFVLDDEPAILRNPHIRTLWPPSYFSALELGAAGRPLVSLSLAINHALGGESPWGYHLVNIVLHLCAALLVWGVVRRTLRAAAVESAEGIALSAALLWTVHPLLTQSVTYVIQRAEVLMALGYLLSVYSLLRAHSAHRPMGWSLLVVLGGWIGAASKAAIISLPCMLLMVDGLVTRAPVVSRLRQRAWMYLAIVASWAWLVFLQLPTLRVARPTVGFGLPDVSPWRFALTQPGVWLHYVRLVVWPHRLCLDYAWPLVTSIRHVIIPLLVFLVLVVMTARVWPARSAWRFWIGWVVWTLVPTSSVIPIADVAAEHRMYLPSLGVVVLLVGAVWQAVIRIVPAAQRRPPLVAGVVAIAVLSLTILTRQRSLVYADQLTMWADTTAARPSNPRAQHNLGYALAQQGRWDEAIPHYQEAIRLKPSYAEAHVDLGVALAGRGGLPTAITHFERAVQLKPNDPIAHASLGFALAQQGRLDEAITHDHIALRLRPDDAQTWVHLGGALAQQARWAEAVAAYARAIALRPDSIEARVSLGSVFAKQGRYAQARQQLEQALRGQPASAPAHYNLGVVQAATGDLNGALASYRRAIELDPPYVPAHVNLGSVLRRLHQLDEAIAEYQTAIRLSPDMAVAHYALADALLEQDRFDQAADSAKQALRLQPDLTAAQTLLDTIRLRQQQAATAAAPEPATPHTPSAAAPP